MEEVAVLIAKSQEGDKDARELLIEKNLGLVHHVVRRFIGRGCDAEDLFQIGVIGLIRAIDKFDLSLGLQFSTYAVPMITGEIKRFLRDDGPIKVSRTLKENAYRIQCARKRLQGSLQREPTVSEIGEETGLSKEEIVLATEASMEVESIYKTVYQDDGSTLQLVDRIADPGGGMACSYFSQMGDQEKEKLLDHMVICQLLRELPERDRELVRLRYFQNKTQVEVAGLLGISQVQVSRMEKKILLRMRERIT